jgi:hypothetical protein
MDKIKTLNDLKALEMKRKHINDVLNQTFLNNPFQTTTNIMVDGSQNIKVNVQRLRDLLEKELLQAKIDYDDKLKELVDDHTGEF